MNDALMFAQMQLARGIEFLMHNGKLHMWPRKAKQFLTADERQFIADHEHELIDIAAAKVLPETTVKWVPPTTVSATPTPTVPPPPSCPYCAPLAECIGEGSPWFPTLHYLDPVEVKRRDEQASRVMLRRRQ